MKPESKKANAKGAKKGKLKIKRKKKEKDPNEPQKPISAYALFFKDTQVAIKSQNPNATFGDVSKIVSSMWEALETDAKNKYKEIADAAKKEYLIALAAYRESLEPKDPIDLTNSPEPATREDSPEVLEIGSSPLASSSPHLKSDSPEVTELAESSSLQNSSSSNAFVHVIPAEECNDHSSEAEKSLTESNDLAVESTAQKDEEVVIIEQTKPVSATSPKTSPSPITPEEPTDKKQENNDQNEQIISNGISETEEEFQKCLRNGCNNPAIDSLEWDKEYCSSECVVEHCSAVFLAHVAARQQKAALVES